MFYETAYNLVKGKEKNYASHEVTNDKHIALVDCASKVDNMGNFHDASAFRLNI